MSSLDEKKLGLVVCLSGHVGAGKSTLAVALSESLEGSVVISSKNLLLAASAPLTQNRASLQAVGERLDQQTGGRWLTDAALAFADTASPAIVDAVRTHDQVAALRDASLALVHVHLTAPLEVLDARYELRRQREPLSELASYGDVLRNPTESRVADLAKSADLVIDTAVLPEDAVLRKTRNLAEKQLSYLRA